MIRAKKTALKVVKKAPVKKAETPKPAAAVTHGTPLVEMKDISIAFGGIKAVDHVTIDLFPGEVVGVLGHNGAGKSTLIKILSGAYKRDAGQIFVDGKEVSINNPRDAKANGIETIYQTLALADNVDAAGNLYAADQTGHVIHKIDQLGSITTFAGTGRAGFSGDGGPAASAQINSPLGVAVGPDGSVYIADSANDRIRKVTPNGIIMTIAGTVGGFLGDGGAATAARLNQPSSIGVDKAGNVYFTDFLNFRIRKISPAGIINTVAGTGKLSLSGDGVVAAATDALPFWLAVAADGTFYFTDDGDGRLNGYKRVRKVGTNGIVSTVAGTGSTLVAGAFNGDGGPGPSAQLRSASGVAVDANGNVFQHGGFALGNVRCIEHGPHEIAGTALGPEYHGYDAGNLCRRSVCSRIPRESR